MLLPTLIVGFLGKLFKQKKVHIAFHVVIG